MGLFRLLYSALWLLLTPLALLRLCWRARSQRSLLHHWYQRLGWMPPSTRERVLWVHAVSVGEVIAAGPLIERLLQDYADHQIVVSSTTATGRAKAKMMFAQRITQVYAPYDFPLFIALAFRRLRPRALIVIETELWPNWLYGAKQRAIPVILANARLSPRSAQRYAKTRAFWRPVLGCIERICARNDEDKAGFLAMGASPAQLAVVGNIKYDLPDTRAIAEHGRQRRLALGLDSRFVWCFASSHQGEDELALAAQRQLLEHYPEALLILVPRHPERFDQVAALLGAPWRFSRWSEQKAPKAEDQVFLLDVIGQLMPHFALSDLAVIGGSFVSVGGHNPIEPAALGVPVISGPTVFNFRQEYADLSAEGAAELVADAPALFPALLAMANSPSRRAEAGRRGAMLVERNRGVTERLMGYLAEVYPPASAADGKV